MLMRTERCNAIRCPADVQHAVPLATSLPLTSVCPKHSDAQMLGMLALLFVLVFVWRSRGKKPRDLLRDPAKSPKRRRG